MSLALALALVSASSNGHQGSNHITAKFVRPPSPQASFQSLEVEPEALSSELVDESASLSSNALLLLPPSSSNDWKDTEHCTKHQPSDKSVPLAAALPSVLMNEEAPYYATSNTPHLRALPLAPVLVPLSLQQSSIGRYTSRDNPPSPLEEDGRDPLSSLSNELKQSHN
mmetsp:Transcript_63762/g.71235  ORF Transcript_63762/g.71235 Transcript_63762/m.71235 type:complete len:169 (+) Transcript_63762:63-569(+)